jgi:hypothetical protein
MGNIPAVVAELFLFYFLGHLQIQVIFISLCALQFGQRS